MHLKAPQFTHLMSFHTIISLLVVSLECLFNSSTLQQDHPMLVTHLRFTHLHSLNGLHASRTCAALSSSRPLNQVSWNKARCPETLQECLAENLIIVGRKHAGEKW